jgi:DNA-binding LacI/PurR family transcriptional regulator
MIGFDFERGLVKNQSGLTTVIFDKFTSPFFLEYIKNLENFQYGSFEGVESG